MTAETRRDVMRLALEYREEIWAFLMGLSKDPHRAEDLFQNTYVILCEKADQFTPGTNFLAWARQIARYEFLASVDPRRRPLLTVEADVLEAAIDTSLESEGPSAARRQALRHCVDRLQHRSRTAVELRYTQNLSCRAVARRLSVSENGLYILLCRIRKVLFDCVEKQLALEA